MDYLTSSGASPAIFSLAAQQRPEALSKMLERLLDHPGFDWDRDGQDCLYEHNPEFIEQPRFPSTIPLSERMVDGLNYIKKRSTSKVSEDRPTHFDDELKCRTGKWHLSIHSAYRHKQLREENQTGSHRGQCD